MNNSPDFFLHPVEPPPEPNDNFAFDYSDTEDPEKMRRLAGGATLSDESHYPVIFGPDLIDKSLNSSLQLTNAMASVSLGTVDVRDGMRILSVFPSDDDDLSGAVKA